MAVRNISTRHSAHHDDWPLYREEAQRRKHENELSRQIGNFRLIMGTRPLLFPQHISLAQAVTFVARAPTRLNHPVFCIWRTHLPRLLRLAGSHSG